MGGKISWVRRRVEGVGGKVSSFLCNLIREEEFLREGGKGGYRVIWR